MRVTRLSVSVVISVLLSGNAIAGALEDCAAAYDRQDSTGPPEAITREYGTGNPESGRSHGPTLSAWGTSESEGA